MSSGIISEYFKKSQEGLRSEYELMINQIKEEISSSKKKALNKVR
jgi:hypothetical protein